MGDVMRNIDIHNAKILFNSPVDELRNSVALLPFSIDTLTILVPNLPPKHYEAPLSYLEDQVVREVPA